MKYQFVFVNGILTISLYDLHGGLIVTGVYELGRAEIYWS